MSGIDHTLIIFKELKLKARIKYLDKEKNINFI